MPSWKKVITSGSDAALNSINVTNGVTITGSLNVTGSTTQIGNNNLFGQTNLSGSIVISGSVNALADLTLGGTLRLDPAQDPGNTNLTASFLFTSASNTAQGYDLYYRQDGNLVKFKWLEGGISSGLLYGGIISASGATIYVSSGSGVILDPNANFSSEISPQFTYVTWPNYSASATYLTSSQNTYIYADSAGTIHQQTQFFDQTQYEQAIPLGRATHPNYATITGVGSNVQTTYDSDSQQSAFIRAFGPLKIDGFSINAHPGTLGFGVGSGVAYQMGGFYPQDPNSPSHYHGNAFATSSIARAYRSGSGVRLDNNGGAFYSTVDPDYWDDGTGTLNTMSSGDWQIQRVFANPVTGRVVVYYGQNTYTTKINALQYLATDSFTEGEFTAHSLIFIGYLVLKGQTNNLTDATNNSIINGGIFRNIAGGSSSGGATPTTLNDLADVTITIPSNGQALVYNSGTWENGTPILATTASYVLQAVSASFATLAQTANTASYVVTAQTASYVQTAQTASYVLQAVSASYAPGGGNPFPYNGNAQISGSFGVTGSFVAITVDDVAFIRKLHDSQTGSGSLDFGNRDLLDSTGDGVFNWSGVAATLDARLYLNQAVSATTRNALITNVGYGGISLSEVLFDSGVQTNDLVYLNTDGKWYEVDQATDTSTKMLGICQGYNPMTYLGFVITEGDIIVSTGPGYPLVQGANYGLPIYIRTSAGTQMSTTIPTSGYVRVLGHVYHNAGGLEWIMKFRPSNDWYVI
jgi:hypothetical protein